MLHALRHKRIINEEDLQRQEQISHQLIDLMQQTFPDEDFSQILKLHVLRHFRLCTVYHGAGLTTKPTEQAHGGLKQEFQAGNKQLVSAPIQVLDRMGQSALAMHIAHRALTQNNLQFREEAEIYLSFWQKMKPSISCAKRADHSVAQGPKSFPSIHQLRDKKLRDDLAPHIPQAARLKLFNSILPAKQGSPRCKVGDPIAFVDNEVKRYGSLVAIYSVGDEAKMLLKPLPFKNAETPRCPHLGRPLLAGYKALRHFSQPLEVHPVTSLLKRVRLVPYFKQNSEDFTLVLVAGTIKTSFYFAEPKPRMSITGDENG